MDRSAFYLSIFLILRGELPPSKLGLDNDVDCDVTKINASEIRKDLDRVTRSLLSKALAQFYENYGFEAEERPDNLVTMVAFMAQLARIESEESLKGQLRFLNTHLLPTLKYAVEICPSLRQIYEILAEDAKTLKLILVRNVRR